MHERTLAIFSVSAGAGHTRAAEAIRATAERHFPYLKIVHIDLMNLVPPLFRKLYAESYTPLVEHHPALWGYLYRQADKRKIDSAGDRFRTAIERLNTQKLKTVLHDLMPDYVICTHFLPAELFARWRRKRFFAEPVWLVLTDFDVNMLWVHKHLSGYCVAGEEVAWRLQDRGIDPDLIHVTGIPVMPAFSERFSREAIAKEFGVASNKQTLLLMSGGAGVGDLQSLASRILEAEDQVQIIAVAGRNKRQLASLQVLARKFPRRLYPIGFTQTIERVMAISDLAVTKSGGLTTAECLAVGLPMVVISPIPGQEERNADYLLEHGAALKAYDAAGLVFRVRELLGNPRRLRLMRQNARRLGRPDAALEILQKTLGELSAPQRRWHR